VRLHIGTLLAILLFLVQPLTVPAVCWGTNQADGSVTQAQRLEAYPAQAQDSEIVAEQGPEPIPMTYRTFSNSIDHSFPYLESFPVQQLESYKEVFPMSPIDDPFIVPSSHKLIPPYGESVDKVAHRGELDSLFAYPAACCGWDENIRAIGN
jgi:hypothetical protein